MARSSLLISNTNDTEESMSNYNIIKDAILNKRQIIAVYNGHLREMCPHVIGTKNGIQQCLFYQFGGQSSSGRIVPGSQSNWRCIPISGLSQVEVKNGLWHTATNHSRTQTCVDIVDVEVSHS